MIGDVFKRLRLEKRVGFKKVYEETGISDSRLHRFEAGNTKALSIDEIAMLAGFYGVDLGLVLAQAGYLEEKEASFQNMDHLTMEDRKHIQKEIDYITGLRSKNNGL